MDCDTHAKKQWLRSPAGTLPIRAINVRNPLAWVRAKPHLCIPDVPPVPDAARGESAPADVAALHRRAQDDPGGQSPAHPRSLRLSPEPRVRLRSSRALV